MSHTREIMSRVFVEVVAKTMNATPSITENGFEPSLAEMVEFYYKTAGGGVCKDKAKDYSAQYIGALAKIVSEMA